MTTTIFVPCDSAALALGADKVAKAQAKAEREAKRQAKIAKQIANAPTASGQPLAIPSTYKAGKFEYINTERTAVSEFNNNFYWSEQPITLITMTDQHTHKKALIIRLQPAI